MFKKILKISGIIVLIATLLPVLPFNYWWIRVFDFTHLQITAITLIIILLYFTKFDIKHDNDYLFFGALIGCFIYQFARITPFTPLYADEIHNTASTSNENFKIYSANVLQKNDEPQELINQIRDYDADIMIFMETDARWRDIIVKVLPSEYKYKVEKPLPNTYGILLYSKLELSDTEVKFMVDDSIPSIHTKFKMPSGELAQLYVIHPTPPMPQENPKSTDRDAEMMMTAQLASKSKLPVIVAGDFNDVSWSGISLLFQDISMLNDVRVGRGVFATFDANNILMRWPLDHFYTSPEFRLAKIESAEDINSDHFPLFVELSYEPEKAEEQKREPPSEAQIEKAQNQIENFKKEKAKKEKG